jgi:hypothetical protein
MRACPAIDAVPEDASRVMPTHDSKHMIDLAASQDDSQIQAAKMPGEIVHAYLA